MGIRLLESICPFEGKQKDTGKAAEPTLGFM